MIVSIHHFSIFFLPNHMFVHEDVKFWCNGSYSFYVDFFDSISFQNFLIFLFHHIFIFHFFFYLNVSLLTSVVRISNPTSIRNRSIIRFTISTWCLFRVFLYFYFLWNFSTLFIHNVYLSNLLVILVFITIRRRVAINIAVMCDIIV